MRIPILILALALMPGCSLFRKEDPKPEASQVEKSGKVVDSYADSSDVAAGKASASVQVAKDANKDGKPEVVEKELTVAQANLPRPTQADLMEARTRAGKMDEKIYRDALSQAEKLQKQIEDLWAKVEAQRAEDRAIADAELNKMRLQIEEERKTKVMIGFAGVGAVIALLGVGLFIFGSRGNALALIAIGAAWGSLGFFWGSKIFDWIMAGAIGGMILLGFAWGVRRIFRKKKQDDEGSPPGSSQGGDDPGSLG